MVGNGQEFEGKDANYGTYFNSPMEVSTKELEYEIGVAFLGRAETEGEVKVKKIPKQMVLSSVFKGRYQKACLIYREIFEYAAKNGYENYWTCN